MEKLFYEVVTGNHYDLEEANKHNDKLRKKDKVKAKDMPSTELNFIKEHHCGCCLHYGMALFKLMRDAGMKCFISISVEENPETHKKTDRHVSVYYIKNEKKYMMQLAKVIALLAVSPALSALIGLWNLLVAMIVLIIATIFFFIRISPFLFCL